MTNDALARETPAMTTTMTPLNLYQSGQLQEAVDSALAEVKSKPAALPPRRFLCELLCFVGDLEKVDGQLDVMSQLDTRAAMEISLFRQLLRGEQARRQCFADGRVPEFLHEPGEELRLRIQSLIALRDGDVEAAERLLQQAEELRPAVTGQCDGEPFSVLRDLDDVTSSFFEVLTSTGKYYWVPMASVELVEFRAPSRARDVLWRSAHMIVRDGPDGEVYLPALYTNSHASADDNIRLGRLTDWSAAGGGAGPVRGSGQRMFLVGDAERSIMEIQKIEFAPVA